MKVRALIVEDEPLARQTLQNFARQINWLEIIGEAADGVTAAEMVDRLCPEVVFLDIQLPVISGLNLLDSINHQPLIIFTTAFDNYAISAFELGAVDYLLKPFGIERFVKSLNRVKPNLLIKANAEMIPATGDRLAEVTEKSPREPLTRFFVRDSRGQIVPVRVENIFRLQAADDYVEIYIKDKSYLINTTLDDFEKRLDPTHFRRIHRSHIVNLDFIKSIETFDRRLMLQLSDGSELIASRSGTKNLRDLLF